MRSRHQGAARRGNSTVHCAIIPENGFDKGCKNMSAKTRLAFSVAAVLGATSTVLSMAQYPTHAAAPTIRRPAAAGAQINDSIISEPDRHPPTPAVYFEPSPAPLKAYTYSALVRLGSTASSRILQAEFRFPVFSNTPSVSVQIISSISAVPMLVKTLKIAEIPGSNGPVETQIVVEAETIVDIPAGGFYYANVVVTGVPAIPPASNSAQLIR
jgi:hypothetical protein